MLYLIESILYRNFLQFYPTKAEIYLSQKMQKSAQVPPDVVWTKLLSAPIYVKMKLNLKFHYILCSNCYKNCDTRAHTNRYIQIFQNLSNRSFRQDKTCKSIKNRKSKIFKIFVSYSNEFRKRYKAKRTILFLESVFDTVLKTLECCMVVDIVKSNGKRMCYILCR